MTTHELNEILRIELGSNPYGEGLFRWAYSEDLFWPAAARGYDETVSEGGITTLTPVMVKERMCLKYFRQWVVIEWQPPGKLHGWMETFKGVPYPSQGYYVHLNGTQIPEGDVPNLQDTWKFIHLVRKHRQTTPEQYNDQYLSSTETEEKSGFSELEAEIREDLPAFMNQPGSRSGDVSFPSVIKTKEIDAVQSR